MIICRSLEASHILGLAFSPTGCLYMYIHSYLRYFWAMHCERHLRDSYIFFTKPSWDWVWGHWVHYSRPGRVW